MAGELGIGGGAQGGVVQLARGESFIGIRRTEPDEIFLGVGVDTKLAGFHQGLGQGFERWRHFVGFRRRDETQEMVEIGGHTSSVAHME